MFRDEWLATSRQGLIDHKHIPRRDHKLLNAKTKSLCVSVGLCADVKNPDIGIEPIARGPGSVRVAFRKGGSMELIARRHHRARVDAESAH